MLQRRLWALMVILKPSKEAIRSAFRLIWFEKARTKKKDYGIVISKKRAQQEESAMALMVLLKPSDLNLG